MTTTAAAATNVVVGCLNSIDTYTHSVWLSCVVFSVMFFFSLLLCVHKENVSIYTHYSKLLNRNMETSARN